MRTTKFLTLITTAAVGFSCLTACGNDDKGDGSGHLYDVPLIGNPASLDPQFADDPSSNTVIRNLYSGLMEVDANGNVVCCNAESYKISDDGLVYTFKLREDNYWFFDKNQDDLIGEDEYFPVTSHDYEFALRRVLDPAMKSPHSKDFAGIMGAYEVMHGMEPLSFAEIYAPNDYTLKIVLNAPDAEFLSLMATAPSYPCSEWFFESTKGRYGLDDRSVMSNGAFFVRQWFYDPYGHNNILYMKRNDANWSNTYDIMPSLLSFTIEDDEEAVRELFKNEEVECFTTLDSSVYNPEKYKITGCPATTLGLVFNPDCEVFESVEMRRAFVTAVDRANIAKSITGDDLRIAYGVIPPAMMIHGRSYRELVSDMLFDTYAPDTALDDYLAAQRNVMADELESVKVMVDASTTDSTYVHMITQKWQDLFGLFVGIEDVTAEEFSRRIESGDYTIALYPLKAHAAMGRAVITELESKPFFAKAVPGDGLTGDIISCRSNDDLVEAYTEAEKYIIGTYRFAPIFYKNSYLIADSENDDIEYDPFTEAVDYRLAQNYD